MQAIEAISQNYVDSAKLIRFQFIADALLKRLEKDDDQEEEENLKKKKKVVTTLRSREKR